jgi:hypothetical protein
VGGGGWINDGGGWGDIPPAPERGPVPPGRHIAYAIDGRAFNARTTGLPGYKVTFEVVEGEHKGRRAWYDIWLSDKNRSNAVRDLAKLGIHNKEQLDRPLPRGIRCEILVARCRSDLGNEFSEVKEFRVLGIDTPAPEPFAPQPPAQEGGAAQ